MAGSSRRRKVLLDAGPIIGLYNENDEWHECCENFFGHEVNFDYVVTQAVIAEAVYKIQKERSIISVVEAVASLLDDVARGVYLLHPIDALSMGRIRELRLKYKDQKKLDFADLTLIVVAEDLKIGDIVTVDLNDFHKLQWQPKGSRHWTYRSFNIILPEL